MNALLPPEIHEEGQVRIFLGGPIPAALDKNRVGKGVDRTGNQSQMVAILEQRFDQRLGFGGKGRDNGDLFIFDFLQVTGEGCYGLG